MDLEKNTHHHHGEHKDRPDLAGEYKYGDAGQAILAIIFLIVWGLDSFVFKYSTFLNENVRWYFMVVPGLILLGLAMYLSRAGLRKVFREKRETPGVITDGIFSIVRHPIYLASLLVYLGLIVLTLSLLSVIIFIIAIIFYYYISRFEEKLLLARFGQEYEDYMKQVPMLLPLKFK
jgi:protein-S-isoprenylcysteine O-methyltransferase Ste14